MAEVISRWESAADGEAPQRLTYAHIAREAITTPYKVKKVLMAETEEEVKTLNWTNGRPLVEKEITLEMAKWATSKDVLRKQYHLTLKERAAVFNDRFGTALNERELRKYYTTFKVTM